MISFNIKNVLCNTLRFCTVSFVYFLSMTVLMSCTNDGYDGLGEYENNDIVLPASSDSTGIVIGGSDFGFDDDDQTTSIHNLTMN